MISTQSDRKTQDALLDELLQGCEGPQDILGKNGLLGELSKRLVERALEAEMNAHLGYDFAPEIRRVVYTTNAIESLNYSMRKVQKNRGAFPNDQSIMKVFFMALNLIAKKWSRPIKNWNAALNQFVILYGDRVPV